MGEPGQRSRPAAAGIRHVDTTRNWAAPKVELALIAIDFNGKKQRRRIRAVARKPILGAFELPLF
ncbi:hypothetical protein C6Q05_14330 [Burkholderia multivorans]|nr:hypothetical protein C6P78_28345 [Burkholderia multivorans]PRE99901.1 hypothetical protein C6Q05_14330 [Burkholderia multivorans]